MYYLYAYYTVESGVLLPYDTAIRMILWLTATER